MSCPAQTWVAARGGGQRTRARGRTERADNLSVPELSGRPAPRPAPSLSVLALPRDPRREHRFAHSAAVALPAVYGPVWDSGSRFGRGGGSEELADVVGVASPGCPHQYLMRGCLPGLRRYHQQRDPWLVRPDHVNGVGALGVVSAESDQLAV